MIYLIDDKKERQINYGWDDSFLNAFKDIIYPIWTYQEMSNDTFRKEKIFLEDSFIFLHESFFNNPDNQKLEKDFREIREDLKKFSASNPKSLVIYFSGSISSRTKTNNVVYMPVSTFYQNLEIFLVKVKLDNVRVEYLLYGENPEIEKELKQLHIKANNSIDSIEDYDLDSNNLFVKPGKHFVNKPIPKCKEVFYTGRVEDLDIHNKVTNWLTDEKYDNIFIPICFGATYSDLNGLRLATHIRCTQTLNQMSNILIYSFFDSGDNLNHLSNHECFNIIKTKNVELIGYSKKIFQESVLRSISKFESSELPKELNKLKLEVPDNYEDNHSIANEFGIYQLAYNAGIDIKEISEFDSKKLESLYFKWLIVKNGLHEKLPKEQKKENKEYRHKLKGIKKTGLTIDLSKFK